MEDLVAWIQGLLRDCSARAPFGIGWELDRGEAPLTATVTPADCSTARIKLRGDDAGSRISFVVQVQAFFDVELDRPVPACPRHTVGLSPARAGEQVVWRCPEGDFECAVGEYEQAAFWPPGPREDHGRVPPMLAERFRRHGLRGIAGFAVELRDVRWVARIRLRPDADEQAVRAAAEPLVVEVDQIEAVSTVVEHRPSTEREPAHRVLTLRGTPIRLAAMRGTLQRADLDDDCDFLVGTTRVRLLPDHRIGQPGESLVLDGNGTAFAAVGDEVCCVGGFAPAGPIRDDHPQIFHAGQLIVYE